MTQASIFFMQVILIVGLPFLVWRLTRFAGVVPLVVVQVFAGLALGPSVFGQLCPEIWEQVFAPSRLPHLWGLQWLAVVLFAFLTGLHVDADDLGGYQRTVAAAALGGLLLPLGLGAVGGWWMAHSVPGVVGNSGTALMFAGATALCAAVTALPVMGAIVREMNLHESPLGRLAMGCAALTDAAVWVLLTCFLVVAGHGEGPGIVSVAVNSVLYVGAMLFVVRPLLTRLLNRAGTGSEMKLAVAVVLICLSAFLSEIVGLHYVFGGFLAGAVFPRRLAEDIVRQVEPLTVMVLLPFFFLVTGLRTEIGFGDEGVLAVFAVGSIAAIAGKVAGAGIPCLLAGLDPRDAWAMGALMQTKGLMEIIMLTILSEAGIIGPPGFSGLLLMALATTVLAKPLTMAALRLSRPTERLT